MNGYFRRQIEIGYGTALRAEIAELSAEEIQEWRSGREARFATGASNKELLNTHGRLPGHRKGEVVERQIVVTFAKPVTMGLDR